MPPDNLYLASPGRRWRFLPIALGWLCFLASLPLATANLNLFLRWRGSPTGLTFLTWLFLGIPSQIISVARSTPSAYIPFMDLLWWLAAVTAVVVFFISPLLIVRTFTPPTLLTLRYLALILLIFPITCFLPATLRYPQPLVGMILIAVAHACVLIGFWCPWPVNAPKAAYFPITPASPQDARSA